MRRILISKRGEFSYQDGRPRSLGYAIKKLGMFFDAVERKEMKEPQVTVSNSTLNRSTIKT